MIRSLLQTYVKNSKEAVPLYQQAFDAKIVSAYPHEDGSYYHCELDCYGQILAVSEMTHADGTAPNGVTGSTMQFCLHFSKEEKPLVDRAFDVLQEGAQVLFPPDPCDFCSHMVDFIDRFGVRWCLFSD